MGMSGLKAQNKPKTESVPAATVNLPGQLPTISYTGTDTVNYVRTFDFYTDLTAINDSILSAQIGINNIMQATQYMDGLGRPVQTVSRRGSGNATDLVSFVVYDAYGRPSLSPMPYRSSATSGEISLTPTADQSSFLNGHFTGEDVFYGKTEFESSPLNRPLKQMAPGNSWTGRGVGVSSEYLTNTTADGVRIWTLGGANPATSAVYQTGELSVMATTDENGNQVKEYTNGKGQVILKKVQKEAAAGNGHSDWLNTYYLYDDYGNLRYVLPPRTVERASANSWTVTSGFDMFEYTYDGRNRMITKVVPGSGRVDMVYDKLDRLVATQDANQRALGQWTFTKYDELSRPVMTGFLTSSSDRGQLQTVVSGWTGDLNVKREGLSTANVLEGASITTSVRDTVINTYRSKNDGFVDYLPGFVSVTDDEFATERVASLSHEYTYYEGYHDATFPLLATESWEMNTVNYYDDYDFTLKEWDIDFQNKGFYAQGTENAVTPKEHYNVRGMATGSKVRMLDTDEWLTTVMFYDDRGRVVQTQGDNHLGGTDISTTQYDFAGRVLHTYTLHKNPNALVKTTTRILKRFAYDHVGRLLKISQKLDNTGSLKTLVANSYNAMGELDSKTLGDNLESLDYDYNIRGWLKSINGDYVANGTGGHFFGMDLSYDYGFETNQLNGNIAGVTWRSQSSDKKRAYGFDYDPVNRLTEADYHQNDGEANAWSRATADFSTSYGYDANGNILSLMRKGVVAGTVTTIDQLTYDYGDGFGIAAGSNQLARVRDTEGDLSQGDFKDGTNTGDDYDYDLNGNMKDDLNKGITNITYNHLNLPVVVSFGSSKSITYAYDAAGIKLSKVVNDNGSITTTDYAGGFIYENNALQHFAHEEGRVRTNNAGNLVFDYFIKDHLGNTRMTLTEARDSTVYDATMETSLATFEESVFLNVAATRSSEEAFMGAASAKLGPESIGPAKMLVVSPGDTVDLSVYVKYPASFTSTEEGNTTTIGAALASAFGVNGGAATVYEQGVYDNLNNNAGSFLASALSTGSSAVPKAYLNYVFFDQDFNFIDSKSDYVPVDAGANGVFNILQANGLIMEQAGYLYVYVSNEGRTADGGNVYFDELRINHKKGHILQEDHYYPFGMSINALSSSAPLSKPNQFKYTGMEFQDDFSFDTYDYGARGYDPQIGRFMQIDPHADSYHSVSPYNYAFNNPILYNDPTGMDGTIYLQVIETDDEKYNAKMREQITETVKLLNNAYKELGVDLNVEAHYGDKIMTKEEFYSREATENSAAAHETDSYVVIGALSELNKVDQENQEQNRGWGEVKIGRDQGKGTGSDNFSMINTGYMMTSNGQVPHLWNSGEDFTSPAQKLYRHVQHETGHPKFRGHPRNHNGLGFTNEASGHVSGTVMQVTPKANSGHDVYMQRVLIGIHNYSPGFVGPIQVPNFPLFGNY
ncbi:MAG: hypothetical protein Roseis2KO_21290 [Roseivirga sp.]